MSGLHKSHGFQRSKVMLGALGPIHRLESVSCGPMTRRGHAAQRKEQLKQQKELFSIPLYLIFLMIHIKHSTYASILFLRYSKEGPLVARKF